MARSRSAGRRFTTLPVGLPAELVERRAHACRLLKARALESPDAAAEFLDERGLLTLTPDCSLPSLFGACHEEAYAPGKGGYGSWPKTKWWWGGELADRDGVVCAKLHDGKLLFLSRALADAVDPLCRAALRAADEGELGDNAQRLVLELRKAGPLSPDEIKKRLALEKVALRTLRGKLERAGAIVSHSFEVGTEGGGHRHVSELRRWDQAHPIARDGDPQRALEDLVVAGVRAAVVAPEDEVRGWFSWKVAGTMLETLVASGRLQRPATGWVVFAG